MRWWRALNRRFLLRYRMEYVLALVLLHGARAMSPRFAWGCARLLGSILYALGVRRRVALANLAIAFPERTEAERSAIARRSLQHFCCMAVDLILQNRMLHARNLDEHFQVTGWAKEHLAKHGIEELRRRATRLLFVTAHVGNWELASGYFSLLGVPIAPVYRSPQNPFLERLLRSLRLERVYDMIERRGAVQEMLRRLDGGENIGILFDQEALYGLFVPFFGQPACTHKTPAVLVRDFGIRVFWGTMIRRGDFLQYEGRGDLLVFDERTDDREADLCRILVDLNARLEAVIRENPEQYFWMHRRWKRSGAHSRVRAEP
ncbi:MAG: lysophospholipid acyltransferase family protein [Planctomycetaceae bacterium]